MHKQGVLTDLDWHFARFIERLAGGQSPGLALAAALASRATGRGDICVNLRQWAGRIHAGNSDTEALIPIPSISEWLNELHASPVVGRPGERQPLVLDQRGRLYLYRYWQYEQQIADDLLSRANSVPDTVDEVRLRSDLQRLFPRPSQLEGADWQKVAAVVAMLKRLCVISGGPGTGKTSTVLRILALLTSQSGKRPLRIALTAPTGKAAARLQESIRAAKPDLGLTPEQLAQIPDEASTLHRLLGSRPNSVSFYHNRGNPLLLDVLVIDELSMVGLALMARTLEALPGNARLILLGDKDQLASVEAGAVLGEICIGGGRFSPDYQMKLVDLTGENLPPAKPSISPLADTIVLLRHSFRFGVHSGISALARAVNSGKATEATALLTEAKYEDIGWHNILGAADLSALLSEAITVGFLPYFQAVQASADPVAIFKVFSRFRVLCALRKGALGVKALNRLCEAIFYRRGLMNTRQSWYLGRPVMIVRNDYNLCLFNGDIGITLPDTDNPGQMKVFFIDHNGMLRGIAPARLPEHETVYAMTIHKSQGSEFDHVLVIMPDEAPRMLSRELVYTALTRAKRHAVFYSTPTVFSSAVKRRLRRSSGLRDRLWSAEARPG
ncbi:MAG: exodeoxyribonuclease V subunit alpha [Candidatus Contendobacter odensis]|uniref:RecBCD enzyme subunit RecD n=1 Tax=Candidatus Contendibacter odensensis TaxID=1400860 RepID=A0A2G6PGK4_9GAMM|nr:MAG: exodeoxyribonuclease V subunit alpha [Candidatus Contendobacter odensis]